jgi:hypothetical protein
VSISFVTGCPHADVSHRRRTEVFECVVAITRETDYANFDRCDPQGSSILIRLLKVRGCGLLIGKYADVTVQPSSSRPSGLARESESFAQVLPRSSQRTCLRPRTKARHLDSGVSRSIASPCKFKRESFPRRRFTSRGRSNLARASGTLVAPLSTLRPRSKGGSFSCSTLTASSASKRSKTRFWDWSALVNNQVRAPSIRVVVR